ncbi:helix-turn-helix transcriptional regulator [Streptomyces sp. NPDC049577]|uniref:response regulator transcription factor n=1 Tax=Streptomyces sp. NPDC049577 TaxID=3155153 RepID=UPI0034149AAE
MAAHPLPAEGEPLTAGELEVLELISKGMTDAAAARALGISPAAVNSRVRRAFVKLGAHQRAHAVAIAYERGLLGTAGPPLTSLDTVRTAVREAAADALLSLAHQLASRDAGTRGLDAAADGEARRDCPCRGSSDE